MLNALPRRIYSYRYDRYGLLQTATLRGIFARFVGLDGWTIPFNELLDAINDSVGKRGPYKKTRACLGNSQRTDPCWMSESLFPTESSIMSCRESITRSYDMCIITILRKNH